MAEKLIWQGWKVSLKLEYGQAGQIIEEQFIGFAIHLKNNETIEVKDKYHYSDWAEVKIRLSKLRDDIIAKWEQVQKK